MLATIAALLGAPRPSLRAVHLAALESEQRSLEGLERLVDQAEPAAHAADPAHGVVHGINAARAYEPFSDGGSLERRVDGTPASYAPTDPKELLYDAAAEGNAGKVHRLMDSPPVDGYTDDDGLTALMVAAFRGHKEVVAVLLEAGASIEAADKDGDTALILAAAAGQKEVVAALLKAPGADVKTFVNAKNNKDGATALMAAAAYGQNEVVAVLLEAGADVNARDNFEDTALMYAAYNGEMEVVAALLDAGANPAAKDDADKMAREYAQEEGHAAVVELLDAKAAEKAASRDAQPGPRPGRRWHLRTAQRIHVAPKKK